MTDEDEYYSYLWNNGMICSKHPHTNCPLYCFIDQICIFCKKKIGVTDTPCQCTYDNFVANLTKEKADKLFAFIEKNKC